MWPAALLCTALAVLFGYTVAGRSQRLRLPVDVWASMANIFNWRSWMVGNEFGVPTAHFWSLAVEEQFYLVFPLLLVAAYRFWPAPDPAVYRRRLGWLLLVAIGASIAATLRAYLGTDMRAAELLVGCVLAVITFGGRTPRWLRSPRILAAASIGSALILAWSWTQFTVVSPILYPTGYLVHAVLVAVLIVAALQPSTWVRRTLQVRPLVSLGLISYGVYLFHGPILLWLTPARTSLDGLALFALRLALTLLVSIASFFLLARPVRERRLADGRPWPSGWRRPWWPSPCPWCP